MSRHGPNALPGISLTRRTRPARRYRHLPTRYRPCLERQGMGEYLEALDHEMREAAMLVARDYQERLAQGQRPELMQITLSPLTIEVIAESIAQTATERCAREDLLSLARDIRRRKRGCKPG